jgi:SAM-dependent methyltransferase
MTGDTNRPGFFPATAMPDPDWWGALWPEPEKILVALGIRPEMEAVDLCCGDGLFTVPLAMICRRVVAIDIDRGVLALARAKVTGAGAANCDLVEGDACAIAEFVRQPVDVVLMANTFHGVPDKPRLARSVASVLKPCGSFAVVNWHRRPREETTVGGVPRGPRTEMRMTPDDVAAVIEPAGLVLTRLIELPPYHYGAVFQKPAT